MLLYENFEFIQNQGSSYKLLDLRLYVRIMVVKREVLGVENVYNLKGRERFESRFFQTLPNLNRLSDCIKFQNQKVYMRKYLQVSGTDYF